jgi:hypothetical protein
VATLTVHWIAHVLDALISVVTIDAGTQHRVFANASATNPRKTPEVAGHSIGHVRVGTLPVRWIAALRGALVAIIAIDNRAQHRVFTGARATHARKTAEVARHSIGYERIVTLAIRRVAGVGGALALIIAVDIRAQYAATSTTTACSTTRTAGAARATSTITAERGRFTTGVSAIEETVAVVVSAIFAVPWLGSFDASSSKVTTTLATTAHAEHRDP